MNIMSASEASKKSGIPVRTIYDKIEKKMIQNHGDEKKILVNYSEVLKHRKIVILLYNMKGGVGKTTTASLLSFYFANKEYKVLGVDLDPQENYTSTFENINKEKPNLYNFLDKFAVVENKKQILEATVQNVAPNLDIIPSSINLSDYHDLQLEKIETLKETFYSVFDKYQIVILDCPPTFTGFTKLGIMLANYILVPLYPDTFSYDGIKYTLKKMDLILKFNRDFIDFRAYLNRIKSRDTSIKQYYSDEMRTVLDGKMFESFIPEYGYIDEVHATKENLFEVYKKHKNTLAILTLFKEIEDYVYEVKNNE